MTNAVRWFICEEMGSTTICTVGWGSDDSYFWRQLFGTASEQLYARVPHVTPFSNTHSPRVQADWLVRERIGLLTGQWVAVAQREHNQPMSANHEYCAPVRLGLSIQSNVTRTVAPNG